MFFRTCSERKQISLENRFPIPFAPVLKVVFCTASQSVQHISRVANAVCAGTRMQKPKTVRYIKPRKFHAAYETPDLGTYCLLTKYISHANGHTGSGMAMNIKTTAPAHPQMYRRGLL